jgi:predicted site-specific integrase-resolvase
MTSTEVCQQHFQGKLLLTPREAAKALSISERTLFNYTAAGKIQATWLSPQTKRYTPAALQAFITAAGKEG